MAVKKDRDRDYGWLQQLSGFLSSFLGNRGDTSWRDSAVESGAMPGGIDMLNWAYDEYSRNQQNQFTQNMYREDRDWQEEMYERYQSIGGQIDQMRQNGINPAMMYANGSINAPAVSSGQMPSSGAGSSVEAGRAVAPMKGVQTMQVVLSAISSMLGQGAGVAESISGIMRNKHMNLKDDSQAALFAEQTNTEKDRQYNLAMDSLLKESEASLNHIDATYRDTLNRLEVEKSRLEITRTWSEYQKILSDIDVNKSVIELNGKKLELLDKDLDIKEQELALSQIKVIMARREEMMQPEMLQLQKNYLDAQVLLTNAKTDSEKAAAEQARANATKALWDAMTSKKLIDVGYYEQQVKNMKTQNGVAIANCIVDGVCKVSSEALGWATFGVSKIGTSSASSAGSSIIQPAYGGPHPTMTGLYQ